MASSAMGQGTQVTPTVPTVETADPGLPSQPAIPSVAGEAESPAKGFGATSDTSEGTGLSEEESVGGVLNSDAVGSEAALEPTLLVEEALPAPEPEPSVTAPYFDALRSYLPEQLHDETVVVEAAADTSARFLRDGGPSIWAIAALSVITVAIILWKIWRLALLGAWSKGRARKAVAAYEAGRSAEALGIVDRRRGVRSKVVRAAIAAREAKPDTLAREDTVRVAKNELAEAAGGLRALELIATIAPLLGLLGTVLGMIAAFQALQESGSRADPALLAGGIWEALLTTAAGMAVAIPASAALTWFEAVIDRMRRDIEDAVTRIYVSDPANTRSRNRDKDFLDGGTLEFESPTVAVVAE
ncbi:MAG: MotA/TolQ/ExbB proton channel family protein [Rhodobacteraceae bacterium]|nr:MotA/TolQ/ExbB proton channel family protein [Paracoccaceae bacterium]